MLFETSKDKGRAGLASAIGFFGANGYTVCLPINDTQDYDIVVDDGNKLMKVQVKATGQLKTSGGYTVSLKSSGGTNGGIYGRVCDSEIDLLYVLCGDGSSFLIPFDEIKNLRSCVTLSKTNEYSKFLVSF
ncbi:MAG: group I intron-associated PD-(D/E)XK endonuclease [Bacteroidales bacterium]